MHRVSLLPGLPLQALAHWRGHRVLRSLSLPHGPSQPHRLTLPPGLYSPLPQPCGRSTTALQPHYPGHTFPPVRFLSERSDPPPQCSDPPTQKFTLIYALPHMRVLRAISRLKLLQTGITLAVLPPVYFLYLQGSVSYFLLSYSGGIALFAGLMLYAVSHFLRRVVGMMYVDEARTTLKVSHLTFWGWRQDELVPLADVMPLAETGDAAGEPILRLRRYGNRHTLYFSTRYGTVTDEDAFHSVFGMLT